MKKRAFTVLLLLIILVSFSFSAAAEGIEYASAGLREIRLTGSGAEYSCEGVHAEGSIITIHEPGDYLITGTLEDGRIVVDAGYSVQETSITLSGVSITCSSDSAIYVQQAEKVKLYMAEGTENTVVSGSEAMLASFSKNNTGAAIYSEDDMDIKGPGILSVYGYINNGITCKDDLDIDGGTLIVMAANNGIRGSESIEINDGTVTVSCGNDALKATSTKVGKGYVEIDGGSCLLQAGGNGISAETDVLIVGGETVIESSKAPVKLGGSYRKTGGSLIGNGAVL